MTAGLDATRREANSVKENTLPPAPFHCRQCGALLGTSWPRRLEVGSVRLRRLTYLECVACGHATRWVPLPIPPRDISAAR